MSGTFQPVEDQVKQLGEDRAHAELRGDTVFLKRLLADDFVGIGPRGFTLTKEQWLERLASGDLRYESLTWSDVRARVYADTSVAIGRETSRAKYKGMDIQGQYRETQIYVRQDGRWLLAGLQLSPMAEPS